MSPFRRAVAASGLTLLASLLAAFLLDVVLLGVVQHARAQQVGYAELRAELAAATAPTGQLDQDGRPLAMGRPVAVLSAPALGLVREVVFEGTTAAVLAKGPGHLRTSVLPGQSGTAVLLGRAWSHGGPFGGLADLAAGAEITVTTGQGTHTYRVSGVRRPGDPVPALPAGAGRLSLVSASGPPWVPEGPVYVDAALTSRSVPTPPLVLGAGSLLRAEQPLEGEPTAWPLVVLSLQGLALSAVALAWAIRRFGPGPGWLAGAPVLALAFVLCSEQVTRLLPNLL